MRFLITGENGFIGRNLARVISEEGHEFVSISLCSKNPYRHVVENAITQGGLHYQSGQIPVPCVYKCGPSCWQFLFESLNIDVVVHNAAVVGTDVVGLNPIEATLTNVLGTRNVAIGAQQSGIAISYIGSTVIYDVRNYQHTSIVEGSKCNPLTYYGQLKLIGEDLIRMLNTRWNIVRPLFAYGGYGDMNSLIAKVFYAYLTNRAKVDVFLDPTKVKDYIFVDDFCRAVIKACADGLWMDDYNVAAETPCTVAEIVQKMEDLLGASLNGLIHWHPETDYLGNHRVSAQKFRNCSGWQPKFSLEDGLARALEDIRVVKLSEMSVYNPLRYLDQAAELEVDLPKLFPILI